MDVKSLLHRAVDQLTDEQAKALLTVLRIGLTERFPLSLLRKSYPYR